MLVFDSNILIFHLNDALPPAVFTRVEAWVAAGAVISVITRIEVLGYSQTVDQFQRAAHLLALFDEVPLHEQIVQRTIALRQQHRIRIPDALIAATALDLSMPLVTRKMHASGLRDTARVWHVSPGPVIKERNKWCAGRSAFRRPSVYTIWSLDCLSMGMNSGGLSTM